MLISVNDKRFPSPGTRAKGFTLLEVLASFVLIAIIIPVTTKGISLATKVALQSKQKVEAASLARTKLTEIVASGQWKSGNLSGDFGSDWPNYQWTAEIKDWQGETLRQLDLHVVWQRGQTEEFITLSTLVYAESTQNVQ